MLALILGGMAGLTTLAAPGEAHNRHRDIFGNIIRWAHWSDGPGDGPGFATLVDHTGTPWPVFAAATEWDFAGRLNVIYQSGGCGGNGHCVPVRVREFSASCADLGGLARIRRREGGNHIAGFSAVRTRIRLNRKCGHIDRRRKRVITCHEQGNMFGVADEPRTLEDRTCMGAFAGRLGQASHTPRHHDFVMLDDRIYDHAD